MGTERESVALARYEGGGAIESRSYEGMRMTVAPLEAQARIKELQAFCKEVLQEGVDYGKIPGTERKTIFKAGAEKLAEMYGLAWRFEDDGSIQNWDDGFFNFRMRCTLTTRGDGVYVGSGIGSCNSRESKYAGRWVPEAEVPPWHEKGKLRFKNGVDWKFDNQLPRDVDRRTLQTKQVGSGAKKYTMYGLPTKLFQVPNDDIYSLVNTIEQMAAKRAFVAAVRAATRSSGIFDQDLEDLPEEVFGQALSERSWERTVPSAEPAVGEPSTDAAKPTAPAASSVPEKHAAKPPVRGELAKLIDEVKKLPSVAAIAEWDAANKERVGDLTDPDFQTLRSVMKERADAMSAPAEARAPSQQTLGGQKPPTKEPKL